MDALILPYLEGQTAFLNGLDKSDNPYPVGHTDWCKWYSGWKYECDEAQNAVSDAAMEISQILLDTTAGKV